MNMYYVHVRRHLPSRSVDGVIEVRARDAADARVIAGAMFTTATSCVGVYDARKWHPARLEV